MLVNLVPVAPAATTVVAWGANNYGQLNIPINWSDVVQIAAGDSHNLVLRSDGSVIGWGYNVYGQTTPPITGLGWSRIAAGNYFSVGVLVDGTVRAWGLNDYSQTTVPFGLGGVDEICAGQVHVLAQLREGTLAGWGLNNVQQANPPAGLQEVIQVSAGLYHSAAVLDDGTVFVWGDGGTVNVPSNLTNAVAVACGAGFTLALTESGTVEAWGGSAFVPEGLSNVVRIAARHAVCIAVKADGTTVTWGITGFPQPAPASVTNVLDVAVGKNHMLALMGAGSPEIVRLPPTRISYAGHSATFGVEVVGQPPFSFQWRKDGTNVLSATNRWLRLHNLAANDAGDYSVVVSNAVGAVASGATYLAITQSLPVIVAGPDDVQCHVGRQADFSVAVTGSLPIPSFQWFKDGLALAGATNLQLTITNVGFSAAGSYAVIVENSAGAVTSRLAKLSVPNVINWGAFTEVPGTLTNALTIAGGYSCSLACLDDGTLRAWGDNSSGQQSVPVLSSPCVQVASGWWHCLALDTEGRVYAWGSNSSGQGQVPPGLSNITSIACGDMHNLVLRADGTVAAWGQNLFGQSAVPSGLSNVIAIAASGNHSLALRLDGLVVAWGDDGYGQSQVPPSLTEVVGIGAGGYHSLGLLGGGVLQGWGYNIYGQTTFAGGNSNLIAVAGSGFHSLALFAGGNVLGSDALQPSPPGGISAIACGRFHYSTVIGRDSPRILQHPMSARVSPGTSATFLAKVAGAMPISYQWLHNGNEIAGATNTWIVLKNVSSEQDGTYQFRAANLHGTIVSAPGILQLTGPPKIISQPTHITGLGGQTLELRVEAGGDLPLAFQWFRNGTPLASQTNVILSLPGARRSDSGDYWLSLSNSLGVIQSSNIVVKVKVPTQITHVTVTAHGATTFLFRDFDGNLLEPVHTNAFQVQSSSNLVDWVNATMPLEWVNGFLRFTDVPEGLHAQKFYRLVEP